MPPEAAAPAPTLARMREADASAAPFARLPVTVRPDPRLLKYYGLQSLLTGPFFPFMMAARYFRYHTLRYDVDEEGITMRWGMLFRREISLTYARIQDIHLTSNVVERWLGLARIQIQTASGSASAEMTIEGLPRSEGVRDFFYGRMRGARVQGGGAGRAFAGTVARAGDAELARALREIAAEVRALRSELGGGRRGDDV
jgi:membrane protein YdbS with pleckstrin-like domain